MMKRESPEVELEDGGGPGPLAKRPKLVSFEPVRLPTISTVAELDLHAVAFANRKLSERMKQKSRVEGELRSRIEHLELRQTQDENLLCLINRHWNRLDENLNQLLHRFDAETSIENEIEGESKATASFLSSLSEWGKDEIDDRFMRRVEFSRRATGKLVQAFDRITQRNERITELIKEAKGGDQPEDNSNKPESDQRVDHTALNEALANKNADLQEENSRLQQLMTRLQEDNNSLKIKNSETSDKLLAAETKLGETNNKMEDFKFELEKSRDREEKLEFRFTEFGSCGPSASASGAGSITVGKDGAFRTSNSKLDELQSELDEQRDLASSRYMELQELLEKHKEAQQVIEKHKLETKNLPDQVIVEAAEYKCLQSQFSVLLSESTQMRAQLEDTRVQLTSAKVAHLKQIEQMESEELLAQKQLRAEMIQLEDQLSQVRREYEMLRVEFEQNLAANEQTGPLNKEMRQLLASCKTQNQQLKTEVARFKKKWKEAVTIISKMQKDLDDNTRKPLRDPAAHHSAGGDGASKNSSIGAEDSKSCSSGSAAGPSSDNGNSKDTPTSPVDSHLEMEPGEVLSACQTPASDQGEKERMIDEAEIEKYKRRMREMRIQLDAFRNCSRDDRDKAELISSERRLRDEVERLKSVIAKLEHKSSRGGVGGLSDDSVRRLKHLEELSEQQRKQLESCKTEEEVLLNEMEVTGQAFEDMQEQNLRLVQQLREKDDANFKLMSERIRSNQQQKLLREEKDLIEEQVSALQNQVQAQNMVVRKLEDKERLLQNSVATIERELNVRQQGLELHKRKALESAQSAADLRLQLGKVSMQFAEAQTALSEKTAILEQEGFKNKRCQEELSLLRKKVERAKKIESAGTADEVLLEEIKDLKRTLTCPSCKVRRKDAIINKCSHVFCMECLKARYETRQRKCPKCNAGFGANDFRRIYIT